MTAPIDCDTLIAIVCEYIDGELAAADIVIVELHLESCPHCQGHLVAVRTTLRLTRALPDCDDCLPADVEARLRSRLGL